MVAPLYSVRSGFDYGCNQVNHAFCQGKARRSDGQINQQLRAAFVFDKLNVWGQAAELGINERVGVGRMLTMKAAGDNPELDRERYVSYACWSATAETAHTLSECPLPFGIQRLSSYPF